MKFVQQFFDRLDRASHRRANMAAINASLKQSAPFFHEELADFLEVDRAWIMSTLQEFWTVPAAWQNLSQLASPSKETDGVAKAIDLAEGFAFWCVVKRFEPQTIVELGVNRGVSSRLWKEALRQYSPDHKLYLCDLEDQRTLIGNNEATFVIGDAFQTLPKILSKHQVDIIFNDAHPYDLIDWSVKQGLEHGVPIFTFHDVGHRHPRGPFHPAHANLPRQQKMKNNVNWAVYGHWERHVMGEIFDNHILEADASETDQWKLRCFDSLFGVGVVAHKDLFTRG